MHVVRPRAADLDVHKMEITATAPLSEGGGEPVVEMRCFSTLPSGLKEMVTSLTGHGVKAAAREGPVRTEKRSSRCWKRPASKRFWYMPNR